MAAACVLAAVGFVYYGAPFGGTKFSLKREGDCLDAIVVEGKVRVASSSGASALLTAADTAAASADSLHVQNESVDRLADRVSWTRGPLTLNGMTLGEAAAAFNRYNNRKIRILNASATSLRIGGVFDTDHAMGSRGCRSRTLG